jgi:hypothetical protein
MPITLSDLRTRTRQRADMVNSTFVSDAELTGYINDSASELYDILVTRFEDQYTRWKIMPATNRQIFLDTETFNEQFGLTVYDIPIESFMKLRSIDAEVGGRWVNLMHVPLSDWRKYTMLDGDLSESPFGYTILGDQLIIVPDGVRDLTLGLSTAAGRRYRLFYIPQYSAMKDAISDPDDEITGADNDLFEVSRGWEDYIVVDAAIKCLQKEESDVTVLVMAKAAMLERIKRSSGQRDAGGTAARVTEVDRCVDDYDDVAGFR